MSRQISGDIPMPTTVDEIVALADAVQAAEAFGSKPAPITTPGWNTKSWEKLLDAAIDTRPSMRIVVARNPHTPPVILDYLTHDPAPVVRGAVGDNPSCPPELLLRLLDDPVRKVSGWARNNPRLPVDQIVTDSQDLALLVAGHMSSTPERLRLLGEQWVGDPLVEATIAANPNAPDVLIE